MTSADPQRGKTGQPRADLDAIRDDIAFVRKTRGAVGFDYDAAERWESAVNEIERLRALVRDGGEVMIEDEQGNQQRWFVLSSKVEEIETLTVDGEKK